MISGNTRSLIQGINHSVATSAPFPAQRQVTLKSTYSFIQGKGDFNAPSVHLPSHKGFPSNSTCQRILGRSVSAVISATIHPTVLIISRHTYGSILEKNPLRAISVTSLAEIQAIWEGTCLPTLVRSRLLARNVIMHVYSPVSWGSIWKSIHRLYLCRFSKSVGHKTHRKREKNAH